MNFNNVIRDVPFSEMTETEVLYNEDFVDTEDFIDGLLDNDEEFV